jgi:hypothetical protein
MRDAKIIQLRDGSPQVQRLVIPHETLLPRRIEKLVAARFEAGPSALERRRASIAHQADVQTPPRFPAER